MRPCCTLAILLTLAAPAPAASIRGHVTVQPLPPAGAHFRPYAGRASSLAAAERPPRGLVTDAVIYVESLAAGAAGNTPGPRPRLARKPGQVNVFCDIHSDMAAFILVVPSARWTRPQSGGDFELGDLPDGRYRLRAWHPDFAAVTLDVQVPDSGDVTQDVSF